VFTQDYRRVKYLLLFIPVVTLILALTGCQQPAPKAADLPYAGKWKINLANSDFGETTITIAQTASGQMQYTADGLSYTFQVDGRDYPALLGQTAAWKRIDMTTWETSAKLNGKVISTTTSKLSADGASLTMEAQGPKPSGGSFDDTTVFQRASGGPGLPGKWKTKNVKSSAPPIIEFAASGQDGLTLRVADFQATCDSKLDGKDYPFTGPTIPAGMTFALQKAGSLSFEMTQKQNGTALYKDTFAVSADGKTLTDTGSAVGVSEKYTAVYDRQ
jgi:hypothetical protein